MKKPCSDDISKQGFRRLLVSHWRQVWGPERDASRITQIHTVQLLIAFHRRRTTRLEVSIDDPFPEKPRPKPPVNVIQQALMVRAFMHANPDENYLSAAPKLNIHRKRIAKLLRLIENLPDDFIEQTKECRDEKMLHKMSVERLIRDLAFKTTPKPLASTPATQTKVSS